MDNFEQESNMNLEALVVYLFGFGRVTSYFSIHLCDPNRRTVGDGRLGGRLTYSSTTPVISIRLDLWPFVKGRLGLLVLDLFANQIR